MLLILIKVCRLHSWSWRMGGRIAMGSSGTTAGLFPWGGDQVVSAAAVACNNIPSTPWLLQTTTWFEGGRAACGGVSVLCDCQHDAALGPGCHWLMPQCARCVLGAYMTQLSSILQWWLQQLHKQRTAVRRTAAALVNAHQQRQPPARAGPVESSCIAVRGTAGKCCMVGNMPMSLLLAPKKADVQVTSKS
jgi:hypothetical protein